MSSSSSSLSSSWSFWRRVLKLADMLLLASAWFSLMNRHWNMAWSAPPIEITRDWSLLNRTFVTWLEWPTYLRNFAPSNICKITKSNILIFLIQINLSSSWETEIIWQGQNLLSKCEFSLSNWISMISDNYHRQWRCISRWNVHQTRLHLFCPYTFPKFRPPRLPTPPWTTPIQSFLSQQNWWIVCRLFWQNYSNNWY